MRAFAAIAAACLVASAIPALARADGMPPAPGCHCPKVVHHVRHVRHIRYHVRRTRLPAARAVAAFYYNPLLPNPWDPDYDRAMVLHFRSPPVAGIYYPDPGYPPTPPVAGVAPYRLPAYGTVYQYDGLTGQYVQLARYDAVRALPPPPPLPIPLAAPAPVGAAAR